MRVFNETQRFNQWFMQLINYGMLLFLLYCFYIWFIAKSNADQVMATDSTGQIVVTVTVLLCVLLIWSFKLKTKIDEKGIHYQFSPIHRTYRLIRWNDMQSCNLRKYNALREYGGWGFKSGFGNGTAFNVKGNKGIQIVLKNDKKILIGTQKDTAATAIINRHFKKNTDERI
ncbi:hypothetical protein MWU65_14415 [Cellulophaga sp. F20128]|uniref:hypothetical protein n=1 Tax=Cellulophaga sp. F20128 TaxID=2926413 RepID=UPI001FF34DD3|nr:hypothetical protein [Cellulophaga sp. F20128]MCK0158386.1 hypothetical protein [Cellulophaga sp. F20128]